MTYVLLQTEVGAASSVAGRAAEVAGVISADDVTGPYDVVVRCADISSLPALQTIPGVTRTLTLLPAQRPDAAAPLTAA